MADLQVSPTDMDTGGAEPGSGKRSDYYLKVLSFVASNAWCGENIAVENYSEMVPLMPTVEAKIEAVHQAKEEAKHILLLEKLGQRSAFRSARRCCRMTGRGYGRRFTRLPRRAIWQHV